MNHIGASRKVQAAFIAILGVISLIIVVPLLYVVSISFSTDRAIVEYGYRLIPGEFSTRAYDYLLGAPSEILRAYAVSAAATACGTALGVFLSSTLAYVMIRKDYKFSKATSYYVFFTLLFNGGVVPWYLVMQTVLNLGNTFFALFIPYSVSAWFTLLLKGFMSNTPYEIIESGKMDGASELSIFTSLVLPVNKAGIATVALFYMFLYWNDWWLAMLFMTTERFVPIQFMLYRMLNNIEFILRNLSTALSVDHREIPSEAVRMAVAILAAGPMLFVFPFFQKHFIKGITVGSIKG